MKTEQECYDEHINMSTDEYIEHVFACLLGVDDDEER